MFPSTFNAGYKILLVLHILSVIVAFAPNFVWPFVSVRLRKANKAIGPAIGEMASGNTQKIHGPALAVAGVLGFGLVSMSKVGGEGDAVWKFSQPWVTVSMLLWFIMLGLQFGLVAPAEKKAAAGDQGAEKMIGMGSGIMHLLLLVVIVLMIFKPGY